MRNNDTHRPHRIMKNYRVNSTFITELRTWGLDVIKTKRHVRIMRQDGVGGIVYIASTPSNHRAGDNAAAELIRLLAS